LDGRLTEEPRIESIGAHGDLGDLKQLLSVQKPGR